MTGTFGNPAESLLNVELANGWKVIELLKKKPDDTGGHFSVCYRVEKAGKTAFLKALDLTDALKKADFVEAINSLTTAFIFERDLLYKCRENHLSKVVTPIEHGQHTFEGQPAFMSVYFIIFELADCSLRNQIATMRKFDLAWILRSLHHTAVGMEQLHKSGIAHQDLKPSNVLVFKQESKIGDLGRSSDMQKPSSNDEYRVPGDSSYAPFELFYGLGSTGDFSIRFASDLYHLGSLVFFYFLRVNLQQILWAEMHRNDLVRNLTRTDFDADLPYFQQGFAHALEILDSEIKKYSSDLSQKLLSLVQMLCHPDPRRRGFSKNLETGINQYSLERFITRFNELAKLAEYRLL